SYSIIYNQIRNSGPASREIADKSLKWLLCAQKSLSTSEFIAAVMVSCISKPLDDLKSDILSVCCNLIVLDTKLDVFRFAHLSVREFLENISDYASPL